MNNLLKIGCHVSAAGGVWNAPKNAVDLECEVFQIVTRPPMGGKAPVIDKDGIKKFQAAMDEYQFKDFVVHCPYFINFGSAQPRIYHGSVSVVREELGRASVLGAKYVMTHLGSLKDLGQEKGMKQAKAGLKEVLKGYKGRSEFLLEIAAGSGEIIGDTFEELADFDKVIGLKWLKMSHINDSRVDLGGHKARHEHIGDGKIGEKGFEAVLGYFNNLSAPKRGISPSLGEKKNVASGAMALILETEHDKVKADIKILKSIRDKN